MPFFYRVGSFAYRRRRWILAAWIIGLVAALPFVKTFSSNLSQGGFEVPGSQSDRVKHDIDTVFSKNQSQFNDLLVMRSLTLKASDPQFKDTAEKVLAALKAAPGIAASKIVDPYVAPERYISPDGHVLTAAIPLADNQDEALKHDPTVEAMVAKAAAGSGIQTLLTGDAPFYKAFSDTTTHDLTHAETIAFPLTLIILVMGFGAMIAVALAGLAALTLLPALLGMIGPRVNKLRIRKERDAEAGWWHRWAKLIMRRPWPALISGLVILGVLAAPALNLKLGSSG